jgi:hypothetical protein
MNAMKRRGWAFALPLAAAVLPVASHAAGPCYPVAAGEDWTDVSAPAAEPGESSS